MFKNYLKIALRNILKQKTYFLINVIGLAIGFVCCLLIFMYVQDELSYDKYHVKGNRIYRVCREYKFSNIEGTSGTTTPPMAKMLKHDFAYIENATQLSSWKFENVIRYKDKKFFEKRIIAVDSSFFDIFTIPFIAGNPKTALAQPYSMVITQKMAQKYFGSENPVGKTIKNSDTDYLITGVIENCPRHSHLQYDFIFSINSIKEIQQDNWGQHAITTYILLNEHASVKDIESQFPAFVKRNLFQNNNEAFDNFSSQGYYYKLFLQPLSDIYLNATIDESFGVHGNKKMLIVLFAIGVFILIIAGINYINLTTALSVTRNKEVAMRRILGGRQIDVIKQLLVETFIITLFAYLLSLLIAEQVLPLFEQITSKQYDLSYLLNPVLNATLIGFVVIISLLSSSYGAIVFSYSKPANILKNESTITKRGTLRNGLVIFQFSICIIIIIATFIVFEQMQFIQHKDLGFNKENTIVVYPTNVWGNQRKLLKQELLKNSQILYVSNTGEALGEIFNNMGHTLENGTSGFLFTFWADYDFKEAFGLKMKTGRYFSREIPSDLNSVILNESAVKMLGLEDPIGKRFYPPGKILNREDFRTIIGVVEDFNFNSLYHQIKPLIIYPNDEYWGRNMYIKIRTENIPATIQQIEKIWNTFAENQPFLYTFLDDDLNQFYQTAIKTMLILTIFSSLTIFIACLGLWGIASFTTIRRTKEIAIRKVVGLSIFNIFSLMVKGLLKWVILANIIAWPVAWYAMNKWLQNFAYRINMGWWMFVLAGGIALVIALLTVSWQAIRAATANPVESLRYE
jgi:putative ABC transport system permease protein